MSKIDKKKRYLFSVLAGILLVLSFPFTGSLTFLGFIAWIPLLLVEREVATKRYKAGKVFIHAYLTFFLYNLGTTWWIWHSTAGGAVMAFLFNSLLMALAFFLFHLLNRTTERKFSGFLFVLTWLAFEYAHHIWELSWPWLSLGNTFSILPELVQWYSITGILGGSLWILSVNALLFHFLEKGLLQKKKTFTAYKSGLAALALIVIPAAISLMIYANYSEKKDQIEIVVVQPNIDPYNEKFVQEVDKQLIKLFDLADSKVRKTTDIVLAPETAISQGFFEEDFLQLPFFPIIQQRKENWGKVAFFTGASTARFFRKPNSRASRLLPSGGYYESYNSSLLIDAENRYGFLHKSKLVLGVEKIPFSNWLPYLEELSINNGGTSGTLGIENEPKTLQFGKTVFAPLICYESIYGEFNAEQCRKGAAIIFVITNDGWWQDSPGYKQHMSFSRLRAIENRRSVARSANTGISCFINQRGDVFQATKWWTPAAIRQELNLNKATTFYARNGDVLGRLSAYGLVITLLWLLVKRSRKFFRK